MIVALVIINVVWAGIVVWLIHMLKPQTIVVEKGSVVTTMRPETNNGQVSYFGDDEMPEERVIQVSWDDEE
jgi:hypothetical protein